MRTIIDSRLRGNDRTTSGFTLIEILLVLGIILILAGAAVAGSSGVLRNIKFNNAFNKIVFMVQASRNLAFTGKNSATIIRYVVSLSMNTVPQRIDSVALDPSGSNQGKPPLDLRILEATENLRLTAESGTSSCTNAFIQFTNGTTDLELICLDQNFVPQSVPFLTVELTDSQTGRTKKFSIHKASGIPQVT